MKLAIASPTLCHISHTVPLLSTVTLWRSYWGALLCRIPILKLLLNCNKIYLCCKNIALHVLLSNKRNSSLIQSSYIHLYVSFKENPACLESLWGNFYHYRVDMSRLQSSSEGARKTHGSHDKIDHTKIKYQKFRIKTFIAIWGMVSLPSFKKCRI